MSLLEVRSLCVEYALSAGAVRAVDGVDLDVGAGEAVGVAGESGCGKTTLGLAVPGLLPANAAVASGSIVLDGQTLVGLDEAALDAVRWTTVSVVFQGAMNALNPVHRIDRQILEPIFAHQRDVSQAEARRRVADLLDLVGVSPGRSRSYPHEFSGGMRQRVMIAMALACEPKLLIADEPTTALDVISQAQILTLLASLRRDKNLGMLMISHDLNAIRRTCDRVVVMYAGVLVEAGPTETILGGHGATPSAVHPYTQALIRAHPDLHGERVLAEPLAGHPPDLTLPMPGCRFADRCPVRMAICDEVEPETIAVAPGHVTACHRVSQEMG